MKKFTYLLFLAIGVTSCSVESMDSTENLLTADFSFDDSEFEVVSHQYYMGNDKNLVYKGTLSVSQDCDNLYVAISGNPEEFYLGIYDEVENPPLKSNDDKKINHEAFQSNLTTATNYEWVFPLGSFTTTNIKIFARGWGGEYAGTEVYKDGNYLVYSLSSCEKNCESGYMIGDRNFNEIGTSNNWGWAHKFEFSDSGSETREIHHKNGSLGGTVSVSYDNGVISIAEGMGVSISHLYISDTEPTTTNAPGKFDKDQNFTDADGTFWIMLKADVCN